MIKVSTSQLTTGAHPALSAQHNPLWRNWLARLTVTSVAIRRLEVRAFPEED